MSIIKSNKEITKEWLEKVLNSEIGNFEITNSYNTPASEIVKITAKNGTEEKKLFFKISQYSRKEVQFYNEVALKMAEDNININLLNCYYASYDKEIDLSNVILNDVSETHYNSEWPLPVKLENYYAAIDKLAEFHGFWWESPEINQYVGSGPGEEKLINGFYKKTWKLIESFIDFMGNRLIQKHLDNFESIYKNTPKFLKRFASHKQRTLIRNDNHIWNYMFPKSEETEVLLVDWQAWEAGLAVEDLICMIAMQLYPNIRKDHERAMLKFYCEKIRQIGIKDYSFDELFYDYRLALGVRIIAWPIFQWKCEVPASHWYNNFEKLMMAYEDLNCDKI